MFQFDIRGTIRGTAALLVLLILLGCNLISSDEESTPVRENEVTATVEPTAAATKIVEEEATATSMPSATETPVPTNTPEDTPTATPDVGATQTATRNIWCDLDEDGDGLTNCEETDEFQTLFNSRDTDNDGLNDFDEVIIANTDPLNSDTDGDTLLDGAEENDECLSPLSTDTDADGIPDSVDPEPCLGITPTAFPPPATQPAATQPPPGPSDADAAVQMDGLLRSMGGMIDGALRSGVLDCGEWVATWDIFMAIPAAGSQTQFARATILEFSEMTDNCRSFLATGDSSTIPFQQWGTIRQAINTALEAIRPLVEGG